jgi:thiosulfate reductase cytochrome b subunit
MATSKVIHPAIVRVTHWINALAIGVMIMSGWVIHNAHPTLPFAISDRLTLGLGFIDALRWHFAATWVLIANFPVMLAFGLVSGRYVRKLLPFSFAELITTMRDALSGRLSHADLSVYNAVQKLLYLGVLATILLIILTGLSIWKPVQFQPLTALFGDFDTARLIHFCAMSAIVLFLLVHVTMTFVAPRTLLAMVRGR